MTPIRVTVQDTPGLWRRVEVRCPCCQAGRFAASWEPLEDVIEDLREQHRRESPTCQHPWTRRTPEVRR